MKQVARALRHPSPGGIWGGSEKDAELRSPPTGAAQRGVGRQVSWCGRPQRAAHCAAQPCPATGHRPPAVQHRAASARASERTEAQSVAHERRDGRAPAGPAARCAALRLGAGHPCRPTHAVQVGTQLQNTSFSHHKSTFACLTFYFIHVLIVSPFQVLHNDA